MPAIGVERILSFSSEDSCNRADNLLKGPAASTCWTCSQAAVDEARQSGAVYKAVIILKLASAVRISSIDIGNMSSAFVEVNVARLGDESAKYHTLLSASSLMTPSDSRSNDNGRQVRVFDATKHFNSPVHEEAWDQVRIVCSQPFNKYIKFGLSFAVFHSPMVRDEAHLRKVAPRRLIHLGNFSLAVSDDDETVEKCDRTAKGRLHALKSHPIEEDDQSESKRRMSQSLAARAVAELMEMRKRSASNDKEAFKVVDEGRTSVKSPPPSAATSRNARHIIDRVPSQDHSSTLTESPAKSVKKVKPKVTTQSPNRPNSKPLAGVVFVLSGYVNPQRSQLRDKATSLGARYSPNWDDGVSTHLVCAFANTPKMRDVKAKISTGHRADIVSGHWIEACFDENRYVDCSDFPAGSSGRTLKRKLTPSPDSSLDIVRQNGDACASCANKYDAETEEDE